ncbi:hypothetical protein A6P54_17795 [Bacillus sp. MKU004]|nr:hypothetical protein A6P54_17795 [Bacillus sp. MKU004]
MKVAIPSINYMWHDHNCYVGTIDYGDIPAVIDLKLDLAMNRDINETRVDEIVEFIKEEMSRVFFPPVILNCQASTEYNENNKSLKIIEGKFTIIDGQHRLKAISKLINSTEGNELKKIKKLKLPVLIVEGLENYEHRELFYNINKKSKTVDSNISVRFTATLENIIGLKYFSEKIDRKSLIEWERKQSFSKDKIAYIHLVDCIKKVIKGLTPLAATIDNDNYLYEDQRYYNIFKVFIDKILNFIEDTHDKKMKELFMTKIYLNALTNKVVERLDLYFSTQNIPINADEVKSEFINSLDKLLKEFIINYTGTKKVNTQTELSLGNFIVINELLVLINEKHEIEVNLIQAYIEEFYNKHGVLEISEEDFDRINKFVTETIEYKEELKGVATTNLPLNKESTVEELINFLTSEETIVDGSEV